MTRLFLIKKYVVCTKDELSEHLNFIYEELPKIHASLQSMEDVEKVTGCGSRILDGHHKFTFEVVCNSITDERLNQLIEKLEQLGFEVWLTEQDVNLQIALYKLIKRLEEFLKSHRKTTDVEKQNDSK